MSPNQVCDMLGQYKACLGRCSHLEIVIEQCRAEVEERKAHLSEDLIHATGEQNSGMPHGSGVGNPTEKIGVMLAENAFPQDLKDQIRELRQMEAEYRAKIVNVRLVEAWLACLSERERFILSLQKFEDAPYREIGAAYQERYGEALSRDALRKKRNSAMKKIYCAAA